jgi:nucleoside-diphosphate-sugar epimerase
VRVVIAGGHGQVAMHLHPLLIARGDEVRALIRNPHHADDVKAAGAEPVYCDLEAEEDISAAVGEADAVVFAAGAGPGSGSERKRTMDLGGALKLIAAAEANGIGRYVIVSSIGADDPPAEGGDTFGEYLRAKADADRAVAESGLDFTIVRPGHLTDDEPVGRISAAERVEPGEIPRADVAAVLAAVLHTDSTIGKTFVVVSGETPIDDALAAL